MNMSRAQQLLENYADIIDGMITQMDSFAKKTGGYLNRTKDAKDEVFYFDKDKFTSRKGDKKKTRKK
jgi:hypothetical protein